MSLTVLDAKPLARVTETGLLQSDSRFIDSLNEAVSRLHAMGDFVGSVERYGVTVDQNTGEFTRPTGLQNVMRVGELTEDITHSTNGTLFLDDEYAFVFESASPLPIQQINPTTYKIVGAIPAAVDVMGKKKLNTVSSDNDVLAVSDLYAIKLMLLSMWREENNQLELATALQSKALEHLMAKTNTAISEARRLSYTLMLSKCGENTLGHTRAYIALAVAEGLKYDDHKFVELLMSAEQRLMISTRLWETRLFRCRSGILSLPFQYESLLKVDLDNCPTVIRANWHEYSSDGSGYREGDYTGTSVIHRGEYALHTDFPSAGIPSVLSFSGERNIKVVIKGLNAFGEAVTDEVNVVGTGSYPLSQIYSDITSIVKDISEGPIAVALGAVELAYLEPWQTDSRVTRYSIPKLASADCSYEQIARAVLRPRWYRKFRDSDKMQIKNLQALVAMVMAIIAERAGKLDITAAYEARASAYLEAERLSKESGHQRKLEIQKPRVFTSRNLR